MRVLNIATDGLLGGSSISIATRGHIGFLIADEPPFFKGGGRLRLRKPQVEYEKQSSREFLTQRLLNEQREIDDEEDALILLLMS